MAEKKKQHYVPKFYLRNFSKDEKSLNLYNIANNKLIIGDSIRNQCSDKYFYGKDGKIENVFQNIESVSGELLKKMVAVNYLPRYKTVEHTILQLFIVTLYSRTKFKYDELNEIIDKIGKSILKMHPDVDLDLLDKVELKFDDPLQLPLLNSITNYHLAQDLSLALFINNTNISFITSDHPVVYYNKWTEDIKNFCGVGLASKGLLIFLPLSPKVLLLLYDSSIYIIGNKKDSVHILDNGGDIEEINLLQWLNSNDNIYFYNDYDSNRIIAESKKYSAKRNNDKIKIQERGNSSQGKLIGFHSSKLNMALNVSVIKLRKQAKRMNNENKILEVRNPKLFELSRIFRNKVDNGQYAATEWNEFIEDFVKKS